MDKESTYLLQKIDCNCNDCGFMQRDFEEFEKWKTWNENLQKVDFETKKSKAIADAKAISDQKSQESQLKIANKLTFQFDKSGLIHYGICTKFDKKVSFIPNICQLETQGCFKHRRDF